MIKSVYSQKNMKFIGKKYNYQDTKFKFGK